MQVQLSFDVSLTHTDEQNAHDRQMDLYATTYLLFSCMYMNKQRGYCSHSYIHDISLYMLYGYVHVDSAVGKENDQ